METQTDYIEVSRPDKLNGTTYKFKPSIGENAFYITINDTEIDGKLYPYELFVNTKDMRKHHWLTCVSRLITAVLKVTLQTKTSPSFLVHELIDVHDPQGGYHGINHVTGAKGLYYTSVVSEIGNIFALHLSRLEENNNASNNS